ncbi:MAG TPA: hypothetical protein DDY37_00730, partial [Legionella sp.]|nr:hypothetical protein [Legionella sp.]
MYQVVFYGLMASPPTKAHQLILKQLQASYPPQQYTIDYAHDVENNKPLCTVRNDADEIVFSGALESLGISEPVADVGSRVLERSIKRTLAKRDRIDYIEICCVPSADGPPVLGKLPSAQNTHRQTMIEMAAAEVDETSIIVSDMEIVLSQLIGLPSYTANSLIVLRDGLCGLLSRPENLLTSDEKKQSTAQRKALLNERKKSISHYLEHPTHEWLTPHGLIDEASQVTLVMGSDAFNRLEKWFDASTVVAYANEIVVIDREGSKPLADVSNYSSTAFRDQIAINA